jgi:glyoxylase-like metal-dependent hydrolase (beta-lactamase superfamily II)
MSGPVKKLHTDFFPSKQSVDSQQPVPHKAPSGARVPATRVDHNIADHQVLPYCGGISVIFTPGHTPDHISLYHHPTKTLITGDALIASEGQLQYPSKRYTLNMKQAIVSINRFLDYEIDTAICFHGGVCKGNIKERLLTLTGYQK